VHPIGFIIRNFHDAWSPERQRREKCIPVIYLVNTYVLILFFSEIGEEKGQ